MNVNCSAEPCPVILNATCVFYEGGNLIYTGVNTNDSLQVALEKIDAKFQDAAIGYVFQNGIIQTANGQPVRLGGTLMQNTVIANSGFIFKITDSVESAKFITTGGLATQFVKGDGSLDGTSYQPTGNYITGLTGDGTASGPGSAVFTLNNVNPVPGTFGSSTRVPIVTVNSKGLVTFISTAIIPPAVAIWGGITGTITNQSDLIAYLSGNYYPLTGNPSGFLTSSSAAATYVPLTRTLTINGQTYDLSANRTWTVGGLPSQTGHAGEFLTTDGSTASWATLPPSGVSSVSASLPISSSGGSTPNISISQASGSSDGYLSSADWTTFNNKGTVSSVDLTMPLAFNVSGNPITTSGTLAVSAAGIATQYIRGDGVLADFPTSTGGGSSVSYYLNGSISQGTIGGNPYYQMSRTPIVGGGTNFSISSNGYIGYFITDALDPSLLSIPSGSWNIQMYFNANSNGGTPSFYVELYKYDGVTFTLIADNSTTPEMITGGTSVDLYYTSIAVPLTTLLVTDRLAIRIYVNHSGKTITLHTENNTLAQIITTFSTGMTALNGVTTQVQYLSVGTSGSDFNIDSISTPATHIFNLPTASASVRGALSTADWTTFNSKQNTISLTTSGTSGAATFISNTLNIPQYQAVLTNPVTGTGTATRVAFWDSGSSISSNNNLYWDNINNRLGIGTTTPTTNLDITGAARASVGFYVGDTSVESGKLGGGATQFRVVTDITNRPVYISPNNVDVLAVNDWLGGGYRGVGISDNGSPLYAINYTSVLLGLESTSRGFLLPKMTSTQRNAISTPETGLQVYNTTSNKISYYNSSSWVDLGTGSGTVTSVQLSAGTGISLSGTNPITTSGTITVTNSAPDQTVSLSSGTGISVSGTYPNFTITNSAPSSGGTVTGVTATGPITSSGGTAPDISTSMSTNKLIGRGSAGTGVFEEITLGTNLSLSGTTLNAAGSSYTFSTGLTNTSGTITNNLSTGVSGGQSVVGGTASGNSLTLSSTSNATKGKIIFGTSAYDESNNRLGIGTTSPAAITQINLTNTDYTNTNGAGSHIYLTNPSSTGQNSVTSYINGSLVAKWRTDYVGNISWVAGSGGEHDFFTGGDYGTGSTKMRIFNNGNVQISTGPVGGVTTDAGYKLDVNGTARIVTSLQTPILRGNTTSAGTLTLQSTNNATKGKILFGTSAYDEANDRLGIGTASPSTTFDVNALFKVASTGTITFAATNTAAGTTGNQTINKASGTVNIAAAGTTVTVTNSLVTTSSIVFAVIRTNDATATIKNVVPGAGSFTINLNAATTAETSIGFFVIN